MMAAGSHTGYLRAEGARRAATQPPAVTAADVVRAAAICRPRVASTPLEAAPELGAELGLDLRLKLECFQRTGSFKVRGALVAAARRAREGALMVTASAGNHALGLAAAAAELGVAARIFVPASADEGKLARLRACGPPVEVVLVDGSYDDTERAARAAVRQTAGAAFVSSYNDPDVVAGQGTIALELLEQWPDVEAVVVPIGGGGLISGIGVALEGLAPSVRLVGAEPAAAPAMAASLRRGRVTAISDGSSSVAEGLVGNLDVDAITVPLAARRVDEVVLVGEDELEAATARLYDAAGIVAEPSAAAGLAALTHARRLQGVERVACIVTGRNIAGQRHRALLEDARVVTGADG
jgi:threonine dehydratase